MSRKPWLRLFVVTLGCTACVGGSAPGVPDRTRDRDRGRPAITAANAVNVREIAHVAADVWRIAWSPDGSRIAFVRWEQPVEILDANSFRPIRKVGANRRLIHFAFGADPDTVAFCENTKEAEIHNLRTGKSVRLAVGDPQPGMAFTPDGKRLATGGYGNTVKLWSVPEGRLLRTLRVGNTEGGLTVAFSPDGKTLAVGNRNARTTLFEVASGKLLHELDRTHTHAVKFDPRGKVLAVAYVDGSVALWGVADGKLKHLARTGAKEVYTLDWSPNGEVLATAGSHGDIILWKAEGLTVLKRLPAPEWVICVRFSPDGRRLLSAGGTALRSAARKVQVWGLPRK
jgi:WD40 repeat protein